MSPAVQPGTVSRQPLHVPVGQSADVRQWGPPRHKDGLSPLTTQGSKASPGGKWGRHRLCRDIGGGSGGLVAPGRGSNCSPNHVQAW